MARVRICNRKSTARQLSEVVYMAGDEMHIVRCEHGFCLMAESPRHQHDLHWVDCREVIGPVSVNPENKRELAAFTGYRGQIMARLAILADLFLPNRPADRRVEVTPLAR